MIIITVFIFIFSMTIHAAELHVAISKKFDFLTEKFIADYVGTMEEEEKKIVGDLYSEDQQSSEQVEYNMMKARALQAIRPSNAKMYKKPLAPVVLFLLLQHHDKNELFKTNEYNRLKSVYEIETNNTLFTNDILYINAFDTLFPEKKKVSKELPKKLLCRYSIARYNILNKKISALPLFIELIRENRWGSLLSDLNWLDLKEIKKKKLRSVLYDLWELSKVHDGYKLKFCDLFLEQFSFENYFNSEFSLAAIMIEYIKTLNAVKDYNELKIINDQEDLHYFFSFYMTRPQKEQEEILVFITKFIDYKGESLEYIDYPRDNFDLQSLAILERSNFINRKTAFENQNQEQLKPEIIEEELNWKDFARLHLNSDVPNYIKFYERVIKETLPSNHKDFLLGKEELIETIIFYYINPLQNARRKAVYDNYFVFVRIIAEYLMNQTNKEPNFTEVIDIDMLYCALERCHDKIEKAKNKTDDKINLNRVCKIYKKCQNEDSIEIPLKFEFSKTVRDGISRNDFDTLKRIGLVKSDPWYKHPYVIGTVTLSAVTLSIFGIRWGWRNYRSTKTVKN